MDSMYPTLREAGASRYRPERQQEACHAPWFYSTRFTRASNRISAGRTPEVGHSAETPEIRFRGRGVSAQRSASSRRHAFVLVRDVFQASGR
jgi:hypothetical protein